MDAWLKNAIEERISSEDISVLEKDNTIRNLIKETCVVVGQRKTTVTYKDSDGDVVYVAELPNSQKFPKIGTVKLTNYRKEYITNYLKDNIKVVKINLNKKYDTDILEWVAKQTNIQAAIKKLIRKEINNEISDAKDR